MLLITVSSKTLCARKCRRQTSARVTASRAWATAAMGRTEQVLPGERADTSPSLSGPRPALRRMEGGGTGRDRPGLLARSQQGHCGEAHWAAVKALGTPVGLACSGHGSSSPPWLPRGQQVPTSFTGAGETPSALLPDVPRGGQSSDGKPLCHGLAPRCAHESWAQSLDSHGAHRAHSGAPGFGKAPGESDSPTCQQHLCSLLAGVASAPRPLTPPALPTSGIPLPPPSPPCHQLSPWFPGTWQLQIQKGGRIQLMLCSERLCLQPRPEPGWGGGHGPVAQAALNLSPSGPRCTPRDLSPRQHLCIIT